jgi:hypothetical protein
MAKPPPALDEEWYVSIDGEQEGPFSLAEAQRWVAQKPFDAELHCWSEGFDDWLPVDKVSHFRGLRKRPSTAAAPPPLPRAAAPARPGAALASAPAAAPPAPAVEDEPKPLFAATMASLERGAPPMPGGLGLPPPQSAPPAASAASSSLPASPSLLSSPSSASGARATLSHGTPIAPAGGAAARAANGAGAAATKPAATKPATTKPAATKPAAPAAAGTPVSPTRAAIDDPFDLGELGDSGETQLEAMPFDDGPVEPRRAPLIADGRAAADRDSKPGPSASVTAPHVPASSTLPGTGANPATTAAIAAAASAPSDFGSDDDLDIGEVSRVVKLGDIARGTRGGERSARAAGTPVVGRGTGLHHGSGVGSGPGPGFGLDPGAGSESRPLHLRPGGRPAVVASIMTGPSTDGDPSRTMAPVRRSHRRGLIALLMVASVLVLGVIGALVVFVTIDDDTPGGNLGPVRDIDTSRPEDPIAPHPTGSAGPVTPPPAVQNPPRQTPRPRVTGSGNGPIVEAPPTGNSIASDEVEDVARKHQDVTQRCYMRSQRGADAIIVGDVKKIAVTLTIDRDGNVSEVQLSDHAADTLGKCLNTTIRGWKFRQSPGGTFRFSLNFVNG